MFIDIKYAHKASGISGFTLNLDLESSRILPLMRIAQDPFNLDLDKNTSKLLGFLTGSLPVITSRNRKITKSSES